LADRSLKEAHLEAVPVLGSGTGISDQQTHAALGDDPIADSSHDLSALPAYQGIH
jgi:hypothetical protein